MRLATMLAAVAGPRTASSGPACLAAAKNARNAPPADGTGHEGQ